MLKFNFVNQGTDTSPLAVLVHGRAGNISVMSIFKHSIPKDWNLLFLEAPYTDPEEGGFSWWIKGSDDRKNQITKSTNSIKDTILNAIELNQLNPAAVTGIGFSQGGAILSSLVYLEPKFFSKLALLSSFALVPKVDDCDLSNLEVYVAHGTEDTVISLDYNQQSLTYLKNYGANISFVTDDTGHKLGRNGMKGIKNFLLD